MTKHSREPQAELSIPSDDLILPFQADQAEVFGRLVKLGPTVDTILSRHDYPEAVSQLLGEAVALTALLGASLKSEGKFILQASTDGPVDLLVADYQVPGGLRGYARFSPEQTRRASSRWPSPRRGPSRHDHRPRHRDRALSGRGAARRQKPDRGCRHLFPPDPSSCRPSSGLRWRGITGPTSRPAGPGPGGRAVLLVQKLTREGGRASTREAAFEQEDWTRARALAETVEDHELLDPMLPADRLVYRLFHEEQVRAYRAIPLDTYCSCSRARVEDLLKRFSVEDLADMVVDGEVWVTCEFCNSRYSFDPASFADA